MGSASLTEETHEPVILSCDLRRTMVSLCSDQGSRTVSALPPICTYVSLRDLLGHCPLSVSFWRKQLDPWDLADPRHFSFSPQF